MALTSTSDWARDLRSPLVVIQRGRDQLRAAERLVADYVAGDPATVVGASVSDVAAASGTSPATVIRFCRALGYGGFPEFKLALARDLTRGEDDEAGGAPLEAGDDIASVARHSLYRQVAALTDTMELQQASALTQSVEALSDSALVVVLGDPTRTTVVQEAERRLSSLALTAQGATDADRGAALLARVRLGDVVLAFTGQRTTAFVRHALKLAAARGATTIAVSPTVGGGTEASAHLTLHVAPAAIDVAGVVLESVVAEIALLETLLAALAMHRQAETLRAIELYREGLPDGGD